MANGPVESSAFRAAAIDGHLVQGLGFGMLHNQRTLGTTVRPYPFPLPTERFTGTVTYAYRIARWCDPAPSGRWYFRAAIAKRSPFHSAASAIGFHIQWPQQALTAHCKLRATINP